MDTKMKCAVVDCPNKDTEGRFVEGLCGPCHTAISSRAIGPVNETNFMIRIPWLSEYRDRVHEQLSIKDDLISDLVTEITCYKTLLKKYLYES
jgi:hypothetical protein